MNKWVIFAIVVVILLGVGYFAAKALKHSMFPAAAPVVQKTPSASSGQATAVSPIASTTSAAMQQITVVGKEFAFTPSSITVKKGQEVKVTFKNEGTYPHNFTVADLNVQTNTIQPGETTTVTFTPTQTGSFTYLCTVPGHADKGMKGTLTVE